jgi:hypothetical protein
MKGKKMYFTKTKIFSSAKDTFKKMKKTNQGERKHL